jgi:O-antigen/teichoic acid export membrane protein
LQESILPAQEQATDALSTEHLQADLKGRSVRGGVWTIGSQGTQYVIAFVSTVVLARILTPADFGLVAMVVAVTGFGQAFADLGLSEATIQSQEINHNQVSTLFWVNVGIGAILTILTICLAPVLAWIYKQPNVKEITFVISLTFLICGLRVQHEALLRRQMRFSALAFRDIVSVSAGVLVAVVMALKGAGYWALVAQPLTMNFTQVILTWLLVKWIPSLPRRDTKIRSMLTFGGNVAASYLIINVNRSADNALVGWYCGAGPLGLYSRAYNLLMLPVRQLSAPAGAVVVPAFSRIQNDPERFARYYLRVVNLITWIAAAVFGFLFVAAKPVIALVLGPQWKEAAPVFQILAISALAQLLLESTIWLFISQGHSKRLLKLLLIVCPVIVVSFAIGLPFGIEGVALSGSLVLLSILPWVLKFSFRGTDLTLQRLGRSLLCPLSLSMMGVLVAEIALRLIQPVSILLQLVVVALSFAATYLLSILLPPVRMEIFAFKRLLSDLRPVGPIAVPATGGIEAGSGC